MSMDTVSDVNGHHKLACGYHSAVATSLATSEYISSVAHDVGVLSSSAMEERPVEM